MAEILPQFYLEFTIYKLKSMKRRGVLENSVPFLGVVCKVVFNVILGRRL